MQTDTKINVRATIKALEVGQYFDFPLERYAYVVSCRTWLQDELGTKYVSAKMKDDGVVRIARIF